jgi:hypothetical protein
MSQPKHDDTNLSEVKAVLGRLQRISRNLHAGAETTEDDASPQPSEPAPVEDGGVSRPVGVGSLFVQASAAPLRVKAAIAIGPVLAVVAGVAIFGSIERPQAPDRGLPPPVTGPQGPVPANGLAEARTPAQRASNPGVAAALHVASELVASGQVRAARDILLRVAKEESADVAWALARSYDPNFLVTVQAADTAPDVAEATRWYRAWFDIAVKQGLVADSVSLDRIIRSMSSN